MIRDRHQTLRTVLLVGDLLLVAGATAVAYLARFRWLPEVLPVRGDEAVGYATHAVPVLAVAPLVLVGLAWSGAYLPPRPRSHAAAAFVVARGVVVGLGLTIITLSLFQNVLFEGRHYSGWQFLLLGAAATAALLLWRGGLGAIMRRLRARGWNRRPVAIVGTGRLGQVALRTFNRNAWAGMHPEYFISHLRSAPRERCRGLAVRGGLGDLESVLDAHPVSGVVLALPGKMLGELPGLLERLERHPVDVRIVPDTNPRYLPMHMTAGVLDGMPLLSVRESPLGSGWRAGAKRTMDLAGAIVGLLVFALPMLGIALLVRRSGPGPVIFRQERMSLNGQRFMIWKFRTMRDAAEERHLPDPDDPTEAWTRPDDPRITRFGRFLRRTSLDELPQLFNVLLGEMSLVGPRPERPELIERFREDWRGYMLRQNVKAGMTGWAQVNGLRGRTSLRKRLQYDLFYIRHWSIGLDVRILWMTIVRGFARGAG